MAKYPPRCAEDNSQGPSPLRVRELTGELFFCRFLRFSCCFFVFFVLFFVFFALFFAFFVLFFVFFVLFFAFFLTRKTYP